MARDLVGAAPHRDRREPLLQLGDEAPVMGVVDLELVTAGFEMGFEEFHVEGGRGDLGGGSCRASTSSSVDA